MLLNTLFMLALRSIRRNLLRSFLTILGIVIGVSAVITMVTLGNGATLAVQNQISSLGTNLLHGAPRPAHGAGRRRRAAPVQGGRRRRDRQPDRRHRRRWRPRRAPAPPWWPTAATGPPASSAAPTPGSSPATGSWRRAGIFDDELRAGAAVCMIGETVRASSSAAPRPGRRAAARQAVLLRDHRPAGLQGPGRLGNDQDDVVLVPLQARCSGASPATPASTRCWCR
jgi:putative ABC transport system permease protein